MCVCVQVRTRSGGIVRADELGNALIADNVGDVEGGLTLLVNNAGVGASEQEDPGALGSIVDGAYVQRCVPVDVHRVRIGAVVQQVLDVLRQSVLARLKS